MAEESKEKEMGKLQSSTYFLKGNSILTKMKKIQREKVTMNTHTYGFCRSTEVKAKPTRPQSVWIERCQRRESRGGRERKRKRRKHGDKQPKKKRKINDHLSNLPKWSNRRKSKWFKQGMKRRQEHMRRKENQRLTTSINQLP